MTKATPPSFNPFPINLSKNTPDNQLCARDKAHRRKYEAVLDIDPKLK